MISAWRIDKSNRAKSEAFSGEGGVRASGRWNRLGTRIVYTAQSLSLAALEKFIHMGDEGREIELVSYKVEIPAGVKIRVLKELPPDWREIPAPPSTMELGTSWIAAASTAVLMVPSVVIEDESNLLLNPLHPDFRKIRISGPKPLRFDSRMWDNH